MAVNWKEIDRLARAHKLVDAAFSEKDLLRTLKVWWCLKYSRPFKDPLLNQYTLDELAYEYLVHFYMDPQNDPEKKQAEEEAEKEDEDWIMEQMRRIQAEKDKKKQPEEPPKKELEEPELPPEISTTFDE